MYTTFHTQARSMRLVPHIAGAPHWEKYYKAMSTGQLRPPVIQKGYGITLGPRLHARNYRSVDDTVEPMNIIAPAAAAGTARALSEIKKRRSDAQIKKSGGLVGRGQKRKAPGPAHGSKSKKKAKRSHKKKAVGAKQKRTVKRIVGKKPMARDIFM